MSNNLDIEDLLGITNPKEWYIKGSKYLCTARGMLRLKYDRGRDAYVLLSWKDPYERFTKTPVDYGRARRNGEQGWVEVYPRTLGYVDNETFNKFKEMIENNKKGINIKENMEKKIVKISESQLKNIIKESIKKVLKEESDDFIAHGYKTDSNWGG